MKKQDSLKFHELTMYAVSLQDHIAYYLRCGRKEDVEFTKAELERVKNELKELKVKEN